MMRIGEWVLHRLCRPMPPDTNPWTPPSADEQWAGFRNKFIQPIESYLTGRLLEIGSGNGLLAEGLRNAGTGFPLATDRWDEFGAMINKCVRDRQGLTFARADARHLPFEDGLFNAVISEDGFEHFMNYKLAIAEAHRVLARGGYFLVTFGPPWLSPRGGHMMFLRPPPWFHVLFSERTIFNVRARYRSDGITTWSEGYSPLSKITVADFRRSARQAGFEPVLERLWPVSGLTALSLIPVIREFFCNLYAGVWRK